MGTRVGGLLASRATSEATLPSGAQDYSSSRTATVRSKLTKPTGGGAARRTGGKLRWCCSSQPFGCRSVNRRPRPRRAVTLLELLVVIGVVLVLAAMLLPALQRAREQARRMRCASQLGQLAKGLAAYHTVWGCLPGVVYDGTVGQRLPAEGYILASPQLAVLPHVGYEDVYNAVNFSGYWADPLEDGFHAEPGLLYGRDINRTVLLLRLGLDLCPTDPVAGHGVGAGNSYFANAGYGPTLVHAPDEGPDWGNGVFRFPVVTSFRTFTDGLSHTAVFAERVNGSGASGTASPFRDMTDDVGPPVSDAEAMFRRCRRLAARPRGRWFTAVGAFWAISAYRYTLYTHTQVPNGEVPDCASVTQAMVTARSLHPGGVNVAFADGSVRFVGQDVDLWVWRAMATPSGGELTE